MPKKKRQPKYKYVRGVECAKCGDRIWSRYRHEVESGRVLA